MGRKHTVFWVLFLVCETSLGDDQCPDQCYCDDKIEHVSCQGDGQWGGLPSLPGNCTRLELKTYDVKVLSAADLDGLEALEELTLQRVNLEIINDETFIKLRRLTKLDLSENSLVNIRSETLRGLYNLRHLDLSSNRLQYIEEAFASLGRMEQLNLRSNQLFNLTMLTFVGLDSLRYLDLDDNKISFIEIKTFLSLRVLAHLTLSNNQLVTLKTLDFSSPRLQYMDISHSSLIQVPTNLSKFVKDLRLAKNNITRVKKDDFKNYLYLELLVLDDNMIADIEDGTWARHQYLLRIWLNGNSLVKIPSDLPTNLRALFIEENSITKLSENSFEGLVNLEHLYLQRNNIKDISVFAFDRLRNLKTLDLQANSIQTIPEHLFRHLRALQELDLSQNNIQQMDRSCFFGLQHLSKLHISRMNQDISFNENTFDYLKNLETLEMYDSSKLARRVLNSTQALRRLRNLQVLNIMRNDITQLRKDFQSFFPYLREFKISENNWNCVQEIVWLSDWMTTSPSMFIDAENVVCSTPASLQNTPLALLMQNNFSTESETNETSTGSFSIDPGEAFAKQLFDENGTSELHSKPYSNVTLNPDSETPIENVTESTETFTFWEYLVSNPQLLNGAIQNTMGSPVDKTNTSSSTNAVSKVVLRKTKKKWTKYVILISCLVSACVILLSVILIGIALYKRNRKHHPTMCNASVSSSIAYCPCRDEVLTAFEPAIDSDAVHRGVGNQLYYALHNS